MVLGWATGSLSPALRLGRPEARSDRLRKKKKKKLQENRAGFSDAEEGGQTPTLYETDEDYEAEVAVLNKAMDEMEDESMLEDGEFAGKSSRSGQTYIFGGTGIPWRKDDFKYLGPDMHRTRTRKKSDKQPTVAKSYKPMDRR